MSQEKILNLRDAADFLKLSEKTVRDLCEKNEIPFFRFGTRGNYRFLQSTLIDMIKQKNR